MKTVAKTTALLQAAIMLYGFSAPALAQSPVTVPPASMPASVQPSIQPAGSTAPVVTPSTAPIVMPSVAPSTAAANAAPGIVSPAMPGTVPAAMPSTMPAQAAVATTVTTTTTPIIQPAMPSPAPVVQPVTTSSTTPPANLPTGTPAVVTQVMGTLKESQDNVSVEDLSKAQDALTRLDLLLQIEKKIGEIKKTQDDREGGGNGPIGGSAPGSMVGQIPASALVLPNQTGMPSNGMNSSPTGMISPPVVSHAASSYEIEQISGTNGNYNAILTTPEGDRKTVRAGDKLDGRVVQSISLTGVELGGTGKGAKGSKTIRLHNDGVLLTPAAR